MPRESHFERRLTDDEIASLALLLDRTTFSIFTPTVDVYDDRIAAQHFSLSPSGVESYVVLGSDWCDTPRDGVDYHEINVKLEPWPRGIPRVPDPTGNGREIMGQPVSVIHFAPGTAAIGHIAVLARADGTSAESVEYDTAVIFTLKDGSQFGLFTPGSIVGGLVFSRDQAVLRGISGRSSVRVQLGDSNLGAANAEAVQPGVAPVGASPRR